MPNVSFAEMVWKAETIFSLSVALVLEYGYIVYKDAMYVMAPPLVWQVLINEGCRNWILKTMMDVLCRLVLSSIVYGIWRARNEIKHHDSWPTKNRADFKVDILGSSIRDIRKREFQKNLGKS
jgi:hypothetical protein